VPVSHQHQTEIANSVATFSSGGKKLFHLIFGEKVFRVLINRFAGFSLHFYHSLHYENRRSVFEIVLVPGLLYFDLLTVDKRVELS